MSFTCLNPFKFRAVLLLLSAMISHSLRVLIPLNSGLCCYDGHGLVSEWTARLNPFKFRAVLLRIRPERHGGGYVLIPLNSGLCCYIHLLRKPLAFGVLIPLNSGLCCYNAQSANRRLDSLNPFKFRAVLLLQPPNQNNIRGGVLIPLNSGLCCYYNAIAEQQLFLS